MSGGEFDWGGRLRKGIGGAQRFPQNGRKPFGERKGRSEPDCFALREEEFTVTRVQWQRFAKRGTRPVTLLAVTYEGVLQVTDAEQFRAMLCQGMGRGKAYGLGLMTVMRGGN